MGWLLGQTLPAAEGQAKTADEPVSIDTLKQKGKMPKAVKQGPPQYPYEFSKRGISGSVVVSFVIDTRGNTTQIRAVKSTNPGFEVAAMAAVSKWKFTAGEMDGRKVPTLVSQRIDFNLEQHRSR